jgi:hypothetical protein
VARAEGLAIVSPFTSWCHPSALLTLSVGEPDLDVSSTALMVAATVVRPLGSRSCGVYRPAPSPIISRRPPTIDQAPAARRHSILKDRPDDVPAGGVR